MRKVHVSEEVYKALKSMHVNPKNSSMKKEILEDINDKMSFVNDRKCLNEIEPKVFHNILYNGYFLAKIKPSI
jgi:hypothetical protein